MTVHHPIAQPPRIRRPRFRHLLTMLPLAALLLPGLAAAQSGDMRELINRLNRLETEVQTLNQQVFRGGGGGRPAPGGQAGTVPSSVAGEFEVRLQRLETDVRTMTGRYEESTFQIGQLREQMERLASDIEFRLGQLEQRGGATGGGATGGGVAGGGAAGGGAPESPGLPVAGAGSAAAGTGGATGAPVGIGTAPRGEELPPLASAEEGSAQSVPSALPGGDPQQQYDYAFGLLRQQNYAAAHDAFAQFLSQNKGHQLSANAQYWLAETLYVRNMFKEAALAFGEGYQSFPRSSKAPDNLLKLAMSLANINNRPDACLALRQLQSEYRDAPTTIRRRAEQESARLRCT
ncbi:MAG: hypothetical protein RLY86_4088 [Pseudomonadota bacterium]|jgi:tol-pal system protein YbgF